MLLLWQKILHVWFTYTFDHDGSAEKKNYIYIYKHEMGPESWKTGTSVWEWVVASPIYAVV